MIIAGAMALFFFFGMLWTKGATKTMMGVMAAAMAFTAYAAKGG
jgi:hypothetical protein